MCSCILHQLYSKWSKSSSSLFSSDRLVQIVWHFHDSLCTKQQHFALSSAPAHPFFTASKSQTGTWKQSLNKYGFICDATFFTFMHEHKALTNEAYSLLKFIKLEYSFCVHEQMPGPEILQPILHTATNNTIWHIKDTYRYHSLSKYAPLLHTTLSQKWRGGATKSKKPNASNRQAHMLRNQFWSDVLCMYGVFQ